MELDCLCRLYRVGGVSASVQLKWKNITKCHCSNMTTTKCHCSNMNTCTDLADVYLLLSFQWNYTSCGFPSIDSDKEGGDTSELEGELVIRIWIQGRGRKVTSLVARSSRGRCAHHLHDTQISRVTFAWHMRQIHAGCAPHPWIRRKCCVHLPRVRDVNFGIATLPKKMPGRFPSKKITWGTRLDAPHELTIGIATVDSRIYPAFFSKSEVSIPST
jgi:hypothetical protein